MYGYGWITWSVSSHKYRPVCRVWQVHAGAFFCKARKHTRNVALHALCTMIFFQIHTNLSHIFQNLCLRFCFLISMVRLYAKDRLSTGLQSFLCLFFLVDWTLKHDHTRWGDKVMPLQSHSFLINHLKAIVTLHNSPVWPVPCACTQPYHLGSSSHGRFKRV